MSNSFKINGVDTISGKEFKKIHIGEKFCKLFMYSEDLKNENVTNLRKYFTFPCGSQYLLVYYYL